MYAGVTLLPMMLLLTFQYDIILHGAMQNVFTKDLHRVLHFQTYTSSIELPVFIMLISTHSIPPMGHLLPVLAADYLVSVQHIHPGHLDDSPGNSDRNQHSGSVADLVAEVVVHSLEVN